MRFILSHTYLRILIAAIFFAMGTVTPVAAQQIINQYELFDDKNGLRDINIECLLVDQRGILWVGTSNGLHRYINGQFEVIHEYTQPGHLVGHNINCLFEDSKGNIWIGDALQGITVYEPKTETWHQLSNSPKPAKKTLQGKRIINFAEDVDGTVWALIHSNLLAHFNPNFSIDNIYSYTLPNSSSIFDYHSAMAITEGGRIMVHNSGDTLREFDKKRKEFILYKQDGYLLDHNLEDLSMLATFFQVKNKGVLIKDDTTVSWHSNGRFTPVIGCMARIGHSFCKDFSGGVLMAAANKIYHFDESFNIKNTYLLDISQNKYNDASNAQCIAADRNGIIWVGSSYGLYKINPQKLVFSNVGFSFDSASSTTINYLRSIAIDTDSSILLGSRFGREYIRFKRNKNITEEAAYSYKKFVFRPVLGDIAINNILTDSSGRLILATYQGIYYYDEKNNVRSSYPPKAHPFYNFLRNTWSMYQLSQNEFLCGTTLNGLYIANRDFTHCTPVKVIADNAPWKSYTSIWRITTDSRGNLWLITSFGLYKVLKRQDNVLHLQWLPETKDYSLWAFCETPNGEIWAGSIEEGILCFAANGNFIRKISMKEGLPSMTVCALVTDDNGTVWASTPLSISKIEIIGNRTKITSFNYSHGITVSGFNYRTTIKDHDGFLYFGGKTGLVYFHPDSVQKKPVVQAPYLMVKEGVKDGINFQNLSYMGQGITLQPDNRTLAITPSLIDYVDPDKNIYTYFLEGFDKRPHEIKGSDPTILYSQLPVGKYTLHITAQNTYGTVAKNKLLIPITVVPLFWETTTFAVLLIAVVLGIISAFTAMYIKAVRLQRSLVASEIESLRSQMNPHFFFNALNSIQDYIFHLDKRNAADYMSSFAKLLRAILSNSSKKFIPLKEEHEFLKRYLELEALRFEGKLHYTINLIGEDAGGVGIPPMILQPLIENAIKHGLSPKDNLMELNVLFTINGETITCVITDNGVGRSQTSKSTHESKGLYVVQERLALLRKSYKKEYYLTIIDLHDENGQPNGTEIIVVFNG